MVDKPTDFPPPEWMDGLELAKEIWWKKLEEFKKRGMDVEQFQSLLAHYCCFEAQIIKKRESGEIPTAEELSVLRDLANSFYDTGLELVD